MEAASGPARSRPACSSRDCSSTSSMMMKCSRWARSVGELVAEDFEQDGVGLEECGGVAEDAALGIEEEGIAALAGGEGLDGVGGHAVEPADAVVSGDAEPGGFVQGDQGRGGEQRRDGIDRGWSFGGLDDYGGAHRRKARRTTAYTWIIAGQGGFTWFWRAGRRA